jgi:hypothetical protein
MKLVKTKAPYSKVKAFKLSSPFVTRALLVIIFLLLISIFINIKLVLFLAFAIVFNSLLQQFQLKRGLPTDFEVSTFATVLVTLVFGIGWGIFIAVFSKLIASIYTGNVVADHFFMIMTYLNAAILTSLLRGMPIIALGLLIVAINAIVMFTISKNILGIDFTANMSYTGTNLIFNIMIFLAFSEFALALLRI